MRNAVHNVVSTTHLQRKEVVRDRQRERDRETDRQTDREIERQGERERQGDRERQRERECVCVCLANKGQAENTKHKLETKSRSKQFRLFCETKRKSLACLLVCVRVIVSGHGRTGEAKTIHARVCGVTL